MRETRDEMIERIVDELKALPAVPGDATARVLARVDAARRGNGHGADASDDDDVIYFPAATDEMQAMPAAVGQPVLATAPASGARAAGGFRRRFVVSLPAAIGFALAATMAGFLIRGVLPSESRGTVARIAPSGPFADSPSVPTPTLVPVASATSREAQEMPVPVQFVLDARRAKRVALVGDFNAWDGTAHPLTRDSASGVWSTVVRVAPGRHMYAFLVDDTVWTLDPRAPRTEDADYGSEQSVLLVGVR